MPFYKGTVYKHLINDATEVWSNVYNLEAASEQDALSLCQEVALIEQAITKEYVVFTKIAVRLDSPLASAGRQAQLTGMVGSVPGSLTARLPLFNTVRCMFSDGIARPDQKYLRLPIEEGEQTGGYIDEPLRDLVQISYVAALNETNGVVSSNHVPYTGGTVQEAIQMRQLGWSRRARPGFRRGWVPV